MPTTLFGNTPAATYSQLLYIEPAPAVNTANVRKDTGAVATQVIYGLDLPVTASQTSFLRVTGAAGAGGTVAIAVAGTDTNPNISLNAKGSGTITLGDVSTGNITLTRATRIGVPVTTAANTRLHVYNGASNSDGQLQVGGSNTTGALLAHEDVGSGRSALSGVNNTGGSNNYWSIGFGAITGGVPANVAVRIDQALTTTLFGNLDSRGIIYPSNQGAAQTTVGFYAGAGAPGGGGADGFFYFRSDGGALTTIYQRRAGVWVGIV